MYKKISLMPWHLLGAGILLVSSQAVLADISGKVFHDFNANGTFDSEAGFNEVGIADVSVKAFDASGVQIGATAISNAAGQYTLTGLVSGTDYRVEFSWAESWLKPGVAGGTSVQFAKDGATTVNIALNNPDDYVSTTKPYLAIPQYINGNASAAGVADQTGLYVFPFDANSADYLTQTPVPITKATIGQIGATWGTAYQRKTKTLYASAVLRRFAGLGPLGTGGIYKVDMSDPLAASSGSLNYVDLNSIGIPTGDDPRDGTACNSVATSVNQPAHDIAVAMQIGASGIGGISMDNDHDRLWLVNMADRKLYGIQNVSPTTTPTAADVQGGYAIALPAGYACQDGELRPWAVKYHQDKVYVGAVCNAENTYPGTNELKGFVLKFDPANAAAGFAVEHTFGFSEMRASYGSEDPLAWIAWQSYMTSTPLLGSIEFDVDGSLMLGIIDRSSMQHGAQNYNSLDCNDTTLSDASSAGDVLRFCKSGANYLTDGSAGCSTTIPAAVKMQDEYYWGDYGPEADNSGFNETALGGLAFLPGTGKLVSNGFDALGYHEGGVYWLNNQTGGADQRYFIYTSETGTGMPSATMGKAAGLGDIEMVLDPAPVEMGNRVWLDTNSDGIQDAGEAGIDDVQVKLVCGADEATASTADGGKFYFSNATGGNATFMHSGTSCAIKVDDTQVAVKDYKLTIQNADGVTDNNALTDLRDSDATDNAGTAEIAFTVGNAGENNHTLDIGYKSAPAVDFGDAPDSYKTTVAAGGASHTVVAGLSLGAVVDAEADGQPNAAADGDGADEDGVNFLTKLIPGEDALIAVATTQPKISDAKLDAWIDFNGDGDFDDPGEQIASSENIKGMTLHDQGSTELMVSVPADAKSGVRYARFRLSIAGGLLPSGAAADGEVEDYKINIEQGATLGDYVWQDTNKDGLQEAGEAPVKGVQVNLIRVSDSATVKSTFTGSNGEYLFTHVLPDTYQVEFVAPTGYSFTTPTQGSDDTKDSNADTTTGRTANITLAEGDNLRQWDAGLILADNTQVHCDAVPLKMTELNETLSLPKFDAALGTLTGVKVSAYAATRQFLAAENFAAQTQKIKLGSSVEGYLTLPDANTLTTTYNYDSGFKNLTVADGILDYRGTSAFAFDAWHDATNTASAVYATPADFTAATAGEMVSLPYETVSGLSTAGGGGNTSIFQRTKATVGACVTYTYEKAVLTSDISLTKVVDKTTVKHGDTVVYTLTVSNTGASAATGVQVADKLPTGVTYVSDDGDAIQNGSYDAATGMWAVGDIATGASKILKLTVTVN